jgi:lipopolysaccharide transport system permease protein
MIDAEPRRQRLSLTGLLRPRPHLQAFRELMSLLVRKRGLTMGMARRELVTEHGGKALGPLWGVIQPLFMLGVYAFIYGVVFRARIGGTYELPRDFTTYLLAGLVPWFAFQQSLTKSVGVVSGNANLVKQVVFDLNVLPIVSALLACLWLAAGLSFVALYTLATDRSLPLTYFLIPILFVVQFLGMCGFSFVLAALGVFLRDIRDFVQLTSLLLIFVMPIVYLPGSVPSQFNPILWLNPFTYLVYCYQDVFYFGRIEHPWSWLAFPLWSFVAFILGYRLFRKLRPFFADAL